jgi:hypothetical protein
VEGMVNIPGWWGFLFGTFGKPFVGGWKIKGEEVLEMER